MPAFPRIKLESKQKEDLRRAIAASWGNWQSIHFSCWDEHSFLVEVTELRDEARRSELEEEMITAQSIFPRAEEFGVHDLIDPRDTRPRICSWLREIQRQLDGQFGPKRYGPRP